MSFLKTGAAVHEEIKKADEAQEAAYGPRRFWVEEGKEARITFLDGVVENGLLQSVSFYEHMVKGVGKKSKWDTYTCTQETEACPICEEGEKPSLVFAFTILDHREWTDKAGKKHSMEKRLFVCKRESFKRLQLKAIKQGGLVGVTFDVSRIGEKSASVGSDFDLVGKASLTDIATATGIKIEDLAPYVYAEAIRYYEAKELRGMGFGQNASVGSADNKATPSDTKTSTAAGIFAGGKKDFDPAAEL